MCQAQSIDIICLSTCLVLWVDRVIKGTMRRVFTSMTPGPGISFEEVAGDGEQGMSRWVDELGVL